MKEINRSISSTEKSRVLPYSIHLFQKEVHHNSGPAFFAKVCKILAVLQNQVPGMRPFRNLQFLEACWNGQSHCIGSLLVMHRYWNFQLFPWIVQSWTGPFWSEQIFLAVAKCICDYCICKVGFTHHMQVLCTLQIRLLLATHNLTCSFQRQSR